MTKVKLTHAVETGNTDQRIQGELQGEGESYSFNSKFRFNLSNQDLEDIRWYLEEYFLYPYDPASSIAKRIRSRISSIGVELFEAVFQSNSDAKSFWKKIRKSLDTIDIELEVERGNIIPWEIMVGPDSVESLSLQTKSFVRLIPCDYRPVSIDERLRLLFVISRPAGVNDVDFRSIANHVVSALSESNGNIQIDVLRPPSFDDLKQTLERANQQGIPFNIVHFDGHGTYIDLHAKMYGEKSQEPRGYLIFERPGSTDDTEYIHGTMIGELLKRNNVRFLTLNACRSGYVESMAPKVIDGNEESIETQAFTSLAQEVVEAGVAGVVAMAYSISVPSAAKFITKLYKELATGKTLSESATSGRKLLFAGQMGQTRVSNVDLTDWFVPVVYQSSQFVNNPNLKNPVKSLSFSSFRVPEGILKIPIDFSKQEVKFIGRDALILQIDRAFDNNSAILIHGLVGTGKTRLAIEFAKWYTLTGGNKGPILYTSCRHLQSLAEILDEVIEKNFSENLRQNRVDWYLLKYEQRIATALMILQEAPALWIWDDLEKMTELSNAEDGISGRKGELAITEFLKRVVDTKTKIVLISTNSEQKRLRDLPFRIHMSPMGTRDCFEMIDLLLAESRQSDVDLSAWLDIIHFSKGNPLILKTLVGQVMQRSLHKVEIEHFMQNIRGGEAIFEANESANLSSESLYSTLSDGFNYSFSTREQRVLTLLFLFQDFVNMVPLSLMLEFIDNSSTNDILGNNDNLADLISRAVQLGLIDDIANNNYYYIHPAVPEFLKPYFDKFYGNEPTDVYFAFAEALGAWAYLNSSQFIYGERVAITNIAIDETNLLSAIEFARKNAQWERVNSIMQALSLLYRYQNRFYLWDHLVSQILPDFIDLVNWTPMEDKTEYFGFMLGYCIEKAERQSDWERARFLQQRLVEFSRIRVQEVLRITEGIDPKLLNNHQRIDILNYSISLGSLGDVLRGQDDPDSLGLYKQAFSIMELLGDQQHLAHTAYKIGLAYCSRNDYTQAENWFTTSLHYSNTEDGQQRGMCYNQLGECAYMKFRESANSANGSPIKFLERTINYHEKALSILPAYAQKSISIALEGLGRACMHRSEFSRAIDYFQQALSKIEPLDDNIEAAQIRLDIAVAMANSGRFENAFEYIDWVLETLSLSRDTRAVEILASAKELKEQISSDLDRAQH